MFNKALFGKNGFEYFLCYKDTKKIKPLKMTAYRKDFDETKYVSFFVKDDKLLENNDGIWKKSNQHYLQRIWW